MTSLGSLTVEHDKQLQLKDHSVLVALLAEISSQFDSRLATETVPEEELAGFRNLRSNPLFANGRAMCHNSRQSALPLETVSDKAPGHARDPLGLAAPRHHEDDEGLENHREDSGFSSGGPSYYKPLFKCQDDLHKLQVNWEELDQCCFYFGPLDSEGARSMLRRTRVGTFLVRDSSDSRFLYSLSVKTERGATSARILYENGLFQFDCDVGIRHRLPRFESVLALVDFYVLLSQEGGNQVWRWEEIGGDKHMKMILLQPMRSSVSSLSHLARVKVNQCLNDVFFPHLSVDKLDISCQAKDFLKAYPYRS